MKPNERAAERGSATVELVLWLPTLALCVMIVVLGGRVALSHQAVQAAAADAARAASLARNPAQAKAAALARATSSLANQGLTCSRSEVSVDVSGFAVPVGRPASVRVVVVCEVRASDLSIPAMPGTIRVQADSVSPLDTYRTRG